MNICGFVLAAGLGTRLRSLFPDIPKPLVPLGHGQPAIAWTMDFLKKAGASRIIVNTHYRREEMRAALPGIAPSGVELVLSEEEVILGTGGGILNARPFFEEYDWLVVANADILAEVSPGRIRRIAEREQSDVHLVLSPQGPLEERGRIGLRSSGEVWLPGEEVEPGIRGGFFLGIHFIRPSVFEGMVLEGSPSIIDLYRRIKEEGARVRASFTKKFWVDLGTEDGYRSALRHLEEISGRDRAVTG